MKALMPSLACGRRSRPTRLSAASSSTAPSSAVAQDSTSRLTVATACGSSRKISSSTALSVRLMSAVLGAEMAADAETPRLRRIDHPAGDGEVARRPLAHPAHHERDDLRRDEADLGLGHAEARRFVQDHHVRAAGHAEAAADRRALDDGDGRLRQHVQRLQRRAELAIGRHQRIERAVGRLGRHVGHRVEIAPGAEMAAGAAQYQRAAALVVADAAERVLELQHHGVGQRVAAVRPIQGQPRHRAVARQA